jgi:hypothetical protein
MPGGGAPCGPIGCGGTPTESGKVGGAAFGGGTPCGGDPGTGICGIPIVCIGAGMLGCTCGGGCAMFIKADAMLLRWPSAAGESIPGV